MLCCPMTTQIKSYILLKLPRRQVAPSVILSDQIKSVDWRVSKLTFQDIRSNRIEILIEGTLDGMYRKYFAAYRVASKLP
jgi:mRNA-degrading endonuclease toxin of MazEF toxin-antitoxin module